MIRRPPRSTLDRSSAASDVYKRQETSDNVIPAANSILANLLFRFGKMTYNEAYIRMAKNMVSIFVEDIIKNGSFFSNWACLLYTSPSPRDRTRSRMPSSA